MEMNADERAVDDGPHCLAHSDGAVSPHGAAHRTSWLEPRGRPTGSPTRSGEECPHGVVNLLFVVIAAVALVQLGQRAINRHFHPELFTDPVLIVCIALDVAHAVTVVCTTLALSMFVWGLHRLAVVGALDVRDVRILYAPVAALLIALPVYMLAGVRPIAPVTALVAGTLHIIIVLKTHSFFRNALACVNRVQVALVAESTLITDMRSPGRPITPTSAAVAALVPMNVITATPRHRQTQESQRPRPVSASEFALFLVLPTLVYTNTERPVSSVILPRAPPVRPWVVVREFASASGCLLCMCVGLVDVIHPILMERPPLRRPGDPAFSLSSASASRSATSNDALHRWWTLWTLVRLSPPVLVCWITAFYALFHNFLNGVAELTRYPDRLFYADWWNAATMDVFWRRWNIPMHEWLGMHLYLPLRTALGKRHGACAAKWITFAVSALVHEAVLYETFRIPVPLFFVLMLVQVPLVTVTRFLVRSLPPDVAARWGNCVIWVLFAVSFPAVIVVYLKTWLDWHGGDLLSLVCTRCNGKGVAF